MRAGKLHATECDHCEWRWHRARHVVICPGYPSLWEVAGRFAAVLCF